MTELQWAIKWGVPFEALEDRRRMLGMLGQHDMGPKDGTSEAAVDAVVALEAAEAGHYLFRNNVGGDKNSGLRWGLANTSRDLNKLIKSGDRIGWRREWIATPQWVARFMSREIKHVGWEFSGTEREVAQLAWAELVNSEGGDACFATGRGTI